MAKEYTWKLPTENGEKEVTCEVDGNKYHLYVGDAFVKTVFKKFILHLHPPRNFIALITIRHNT